MNDQDHSSVNMVDLTGSIISAYVSNNRVSISELPALITATHAALKNVNKPPVVEPEKPTPLVPIRRTVTPDHIISLEDGKPYKSLKRHLSTRGLTPDQYRQKWGLPPDYPMVAATYAAQRSELAKSLGLGQIRRDRAAARAAEEQAGASAGRGRPKKTS